MSANTRSTNSGFTNTGASSSGDCRAEEASPSQFPYVGQCVRAIDGVAEFTGRWVSKLVLVMMVLTCLIVVLRYGFNIGSIALQESITYLHATVFLLAMAYGLKVDGHVRVDIFYRRFAKPQQAWVNAVGSLLFLLPLCGFILLSSWEFVTSAWSIKEGSPNAGGLPVYFLLKTLIPLTACLLALQGIGEVLRSLLVLLAPEEQSHD